jgi:hypothetical protein
MLSSSEFPTRCCSPGGFYLYVPMRLAGVFPGRIYLLFTRFRLCWVLRELEDSLGGAGFLSVTPLPRSVVEATRFFKDWDNMVRSGYPCPWGQLADMSVYIKGGWWKGASSR